ncbi:MAG: putative parB-like partition protein [Phycisphaerales bacterium]|nr:putative parB-like partition protein [Phycisphaerales bacterium]
MPAVKAKPSPKKPAKPSKAAKLAKAPAPPPARTPAAIEAELAKLRDRNVYGPEAVKVEAKFDALTAELDAARVRELAAPLPVGATARFTERDVSVADVVRTGNHREGQDEAALARLARLIEVGGLQQRVGLRDQGDGKFELIFGARRLAAHELLGRETIAAKVYPIEMTPSEVEILRTIENFGRAELTAVERALAIARVIDSVEATFGPMAQKPGFRPELERLGDLDELATRNPELPASAKLFADVEAAGGLHAYVGLQLGHTPGWVRDHAYVSRLGGESRRLLAAGRLTLAHARELAKLGDPAAADHVGRLVAKRPDGTGGESVDACRRHVDERLRSLKTVPWRLDVVVTGPGCTGHACATCPFNSKTDPDLFGGSLADEPAAGMCTHPLCFEAHTRLSEAAIGKFVKKVATFQAKNPDAALTEGTLGGIVADVAGFVRPATAVRKAKKELEPEKPAAGKATTGGGRSGTAATSKRDPREDFQRAMREWARKVAPKLEAALGERPGARLLFNLLPRTFPEWRQLEVSSWNGTPKAYAEAERAAAGLADALAPLAAPTLDAFLAAESDNDIVSEWDLHNRPAGAAAVAAVLGIELPAPPDLAKFLGEKAGDGKAGAA